MKAKTKKPRSWRVGETLGQLNMDNFLSIKDGGYLYADMATHRRLAREAGKRLMQWADWAEQEYGGGK